MAFFEIVKLENMPSIDWLLAKHPVTEFNDLSKLVVSPGQSCIIVHNGKIEKIVDDGRWKIDSELIPILKLFQKIPYGNKNPYPIEIYFFNKRLKLDMLWGTSRYTY